MVIVPEIFGATASRPNRTDWLAATPRLLECSARHHSLQRVIIVASGRGESIPLLIFASEQQELALDLDLPSDADNIFQRLIRNPHIESDTPRERECTEMLCAVLLNTHRLRLHLLNWLAKSVDQDAGDLADLDYRIDTEGSIGSKRDDLRIEGWRSQEDQQTLVLLWTIEVKVGAWFHESSIQDSTIPTTAEDEERVELVNQLVNYDHWLCHQPAEHRAGFVLALDDMACDLPTNLTMPWHCLTWTDLAEQVIEAISTNDLPPSEEMLAKHLLGFIKKHLWRVSGMTNDRIEFDDLALLRAFASIGVDCDKKVTRLVAQLEGMLKEADIGEGKIALNQTLFRTYLRCTIYRYFFLPEEFPYPILVAGVEKDQLIVFIESAKGYAQKPAITQAIRSVEDRLKERNQEWRVPSPEDHQGLRDLEVRLPLTNLLVAPDQEAVFLEFFRKAFEDINQVGVVQAIQERLVGSKAV